MGFWGFRRVWSGILGARQSESRVSRGARRDVGILRSQLSGLKRPRLTFDEYSNENFRLGLGCSVQDAKSL